MAFPLTNSVRHHVGADLLNIALLHPIKMNITTKNVYTYFDQIAFDVRKNFSKDDSFLSTLDSELENLKTLHFNKQHLAAQLPTY